MLDAALALLAERGPDALTIEAVAARAGVAPDDRLSAMARKARARPGSPRGRGGQAHADLLIGPVYYRMLLAGQQPGAHYPERIVDAFLRGAAAATDT